MMLNEFCGIFVVLADESTGATTVKSSGLNLLRALYLYRHKFLVAKINLY